MYYYGQQTGGGAHQDFWVLNTQHAAIIIGAGYALKVRTQLVLSC